MRTELGRPVRLADYRPPDWLVDTVDLDFSLHPTRTRVRARLTLRPNPQAGAPAPVVLDGDEIELVAIRIDGEALPPEAFIATADGLTITQPPPRPFELEIETELDPSANTKLMGLYRSGGSSICTQCEAEGFRRITYFLDRPDVLAVYTTRIEADKSDAPVLLSNGNLIAAGDIAGATRHFAVWHDPHPKPCYLFALVGGDARRCSRTASPPCPAARSRSRIYVEPGKDERARLRDGRAEALHALGRGGVRARIRSRRLQHRRGVRLQHGGDGEQGPQRLQRQVRPRRRPRPRPTPTTRRSRR